MFSVSRFPILPEPAGRFADDVAKVLDIDCLNLI